MAHSFTSSKFCGDLSSWKPLSLEHNSDCFKNCSAAKSYWSFYEGNENIRKAIDCYIFAYDLSNKKDKKSHEIKI